MTILGLQHRGENYLMRVFLPLKYKNLGGRIYIRVQRYGFYSTPPKFFLIFFDFNFSSK